MTDHGPTDGDDDRIEATHLDDWESSSARRRNHGQTGASEETTARLTGLDGAWSSLTKSWSQQVNPIVPHEACRDHFANERTFLSYFRTSLALSFMSVLIAQLFRIQHRPSPDPHFGYYTMGKPLACICICGSIFVMSLGAYRSWRQQNAMLRGKIHAGGWEVNTVGIIVGLVVTVIFVLVVAAACLRDED